jgi:hypothetical protein
VLNIWNCFTGQLVDTELLTEFFSSFLGALQAADSTIVRESPLIIALASEL